MPEQHLYEYAVIRVVPRVEREEFLNIGIILFCKRAKFLRAACSITEARMLAFAPDIDLDNLKQNLVALENIAHGTKNTSPIALLDLPERFRWLTAVRSSVVQTSRPHPGLTSDLEVTFKRLLSDLVD